MAAPTLGDIIITGAPADPLEPLVTTRAAVVTKVISATVVDAEAIGHKAFKLEPLTGLTLRTAGGDPAITEWIAKV